MGSIARRLGESRARFPTNGARSDAVWGVRMREEIIFSRHGKLFSCVLSKVCENPVLIANSRGCEIHATSRSNRILLTLAII